MFGIPTLYLRLGMTVALVLAVAGGYFYVTGLQNKVKSLTLEKYQLSEMNNTLTESLAEVQRMQGVRDSVAEAHNEIRQKNITIRDNREIIINNNVRKGHDREVGPVLKDFFNAE